VSLTVAKAPQQVRVPDMRGETEEVAIARLSQEGFQINRKERVVDSQEGDGVVIEQSPAGGKAAKGSTVTIVVGHYEGGNPEPDGSTTSSSGGTTAPGTTAPSDQGGQTGQSGQGDQSGQGEQGNGTGGTVP
jgi:serine/threonine-protein kinase